jgi:hypothetical protein
MQSAVLGLAMLPAFVVYGLWLALLAAALLCPHLIPSADASMAGDMVTRRTVDLALALWGLTLWGMLGLSPHDWAAETRDGKTVRRLWTLAWVTFMVHVAAAMHYFHHWSHASAIEYTRAESGFGEGIYLSHLFYVWWGLDVAWWQGSPASYARRPAWQGRLLHGYMLFLAFQALVVYETGFIRWGALAGFVALAVWWGLAWRRSEPGQHQRGATP